MTGLYNIAPPNSSEGKGAESGENPHLCERFTKGSVKSLLNPQNLNHCIGCTNFVQG